MKKHYLLLVLALAIHYFSYAQKSPLSLSDYDIWNKVQNEQISANGEVITYQLVPGKGDQTLKVTTSDAKELLSYTCGESASIAWNTNHISFIIKPTDDTVRALKRLKTKENEMPKDSLGIFNSKDKSLKKIPFIKDTKMPEKWSGYLAYRLDELKEEPVEKDTATSDGPKEKKKKEKKPGKKNGYHLILHHLTSQSQDTFKFVTNYQFAEEYPALVFESKGVDGTFEAGIYLYDINSKSLTALLTGEHKYEQLAISNQGSYIAFLADRDTTKALVRNYELYFWKKDELSASMVLDTTVLANGWIVNQNGNLDFSQDESKLYLGTSPQPIVQDTTLLDDEIIQVEVWNYKDKRLMTQQEAERKQDEKKSYLMVYHIADEEFTQVTDEKYPSALFANRFKKNLNKMLVYNQKEYFQNASWEGFPARGDYYWEDLKSGEKTLVAEAIRANGDISLAGEYVYWYNVEDTTWYTYNIATKVTASISRDIPFMVADEEDDHPDFPRPYGVAGWTKGDKELLIYDRFDIWKVNPNGTSKPVNLTNGRSSKDRYRVVTFDRENPEVDLKNAVLATFNEETMQEGFAKLNDTSPIKTLIGGDYSVDTRPVKAKQSDQIIFSKATHALFPDLLSTDLTFKKISKLSNANPQQKNRKWSTVELVNWTSLNGDELRGLLYKPEGFDPEKKYPMIVYFYEKNSHNLHSHSGVFPHRSIINFAYYASRGYLVFVPDIIYKEGYPGPSSYDCIMPGVTKLLDQGFVDRAHVGIQGHSWGGYQTAYLITQTDMFACAESGAPVVNMFSAYGGIRWGTGFSRMFQYEHTQSRIGGTIWEYPLRYLENSPLFFMDNINTPVLIMHNDHDAAVPWYQGIEMFVALRRLNKPAWMLNYNDEPHWPTKRENIVDFQTRMQHFFDHYLMDQPMPEWMSDGIPAIEKGINKGY